MSTQVVVSCAAITEPRNPGGYGCGGWVIEPFPGCEEGIKGGKCFGYGGGTTNNVVEYEVALHALRVVYNTGWRDSVRLKVGSLNMARQFSGQYQCYAPDLISLLESLKEAKKSFSELVVEWIPKDANQAAQEQSRLAYEKMTGQPPPVRIKG